MPRIVSFINMKGGVGKTTLAVNIGYALATEHSQRVLLVDCDPQFNASTYLLPESKYIKHITENKKLSVVDIFLPSRQPPPRTVAVPQPQRPRHFRRLTSYTINVYKAAGRLDLIASKLELMEAETARRRTEDRLKNFLQEKAGPYDFVLIDCPPTISIFTQAAILASDSYLVPLKPDPLSTIGLPLLERWLSEFTEDAGISLQALGIVFCMVRKPTPRAMQKTMRDIRQQRATAVFNTPLEQSTKVVESVEAHNPIYIHAPHTPWAQQTLDIAQEFLNRAKDQ